MKAPWRCQKHQDTQNPPPCGACAEARRKHDQSKNHSQVRLGVVDTYEELAEACQRRWDRDAAHVRELGRIPIDADVNLAGVARAREALRAARRPTEDSEPSSSQDTPRFARV